MSVIFARERANIVNRQKAGLAFLDDGKEHVSGNDGAVFNHSRRALKVPVDECQQRAPTFLVAPVAGLDVRSTQQKAKTAKGKGTEKENKSDKASARGFSIFNTVVVQHESELEHTTSLCLQANPDVQQIYSQWPKLRWINDSGKVHTHIIDYYAEYRSGRKFAYVVKPESKREKMLDIIDRMKRFGLDGVVNDIRLVTDTYATRERAENARAILWSRHFHDDGEVEVLLDVLKDMGPLVRFGDLMRDASSRRARWMAIWRLIERRVLTSPTGEKITELTWLRSTHHH